MREKLKAIFGNSLLAKFGRRYSDSLKDATTFMDQVEIFKRVLPDLEQKARSLDQNQVEKALAAILELRAGLREITQTVVVGRGHLAEADESGQRLISRLATGAHLSQTENLEYLLKGDSEGLAQYLEAVEPATFKRTLPKVSKEQKAALLEALLKDEEYKDE